MGIILTEMRIHYIGRDVINVSNYFGKNLKYLREQKGMEQLELAKLLGRKSSSSVSEWEKGTYTPKSGILSDISKIFGVSLSDLVERDVRYGKDERLVEYVEEAKTKLTEEELSFFEKVLEQTLSLDQSDRSEFLNNIDFAIKFFNKK